jgi:hypothetical protein
VLFFFGFLAVGMIGGQALAATFEVARSDYLGASAFLFLLCLCASAIPTVCYAISSAGNRRRSKRYAGLFGGVVAAGVFGVPVAAGYAEPGFGGLALALALMLPGLIGWLWPFLSAKAQNAQPTNRLAACSQGEADLLN